MSLVLEAQTDRRWTEQHYVAEGELVVVYGVREGTWRASAFRRGRHTEQRRCALELAHMFRVRDGLICEHWAVRDDLAMLQQLGALDLIGTHRRRHPRKLPEQERAGPLT